MRNETEYNQFIGWTDAWTAVVLHHTFEYEYGFKGAVGGEFQLISFEEWEAETNDEALSECYLEMWREDAGSTNGTELGLAEWIEENRDDLIDSRWDDDAPDCLPDHNQWRTDCIGGGRIFPEALDRIVEWGEHGEELAQIIRGIEA